MPFLGLSLLIALFLLVLFPLLFGELMLASLTKLHLTPGTALLLFFAIIFGGLVNIPIRRIARPDELVARPMAVFGFPDLFPQLHRARRETVIAINLGGCVIPVAIALYEIIYLSATGIGSLLAAVAASAVNAAVCYRLARPIAGVGLAIPGIVPGLVAALLAIVLAPDHAAPVAFIAGVLGPLIGADVLHLREVATIDAAIVSIGGAGTFDGIVLSGILAAYLA